VRFFEYRDGSSLNEEARRQVRARAPSASFIVHGATPQRDAAVIGFQFSTNVAAATQIFLRYDGDIGSGTDNHALNLGVRLSW
jgi:uncharacterized protein with beta-barrel porin domain